MAASVSAQEDSDGGDGSSGVSFALKSYSLRIGYNNSAIKAWSSFGNSITLGRQYTSGSTGFHLGAAAYFPFAEIELPHGRRGREVLVPYVFGFDPTVLFASKGGKSNRGINWGASSYRAIWTVDAYYLDIHAPLSFRRDFKGVSTKVGLGPYVAIGLFGDQTYEIQNAARTTFKASTFGSDGMSRLDGGIIGDASFELLETFILSFRYTSGLTDDSIQSLYLTLGYSIKAN